MSRLKTIHYEEIEVENVLDEKDILSGLIESYPDILHGVAFGLSPTPSSWAMFSNDFKYVREHYLEACHADMEEDWSDVFDQCVTAVPRDEPIHLDYIQFLINGPYRLFKDRISLEKFADKYFIRMTKLDTWPANVLFNFCIATRVPIEYPHFLEPWAKLMGVGLEPSLAFQIASRVAYEDVTQCEGDPLLWKLPGLTVPAGHFWFDSTSNWKDLIACEPHLKRFSSNYKENPGACRPSNVIWGKAERYGGSLTGKTVSEIVEILGVPETKPEVVIDEDDQDDWDPIDHHLMNFDDFEDHDEDFDPHEDIDDDEEV